MDTIVLVEGPPLTRRPDRDIRMDATQLYWWEGVRVQIGMLEWIQERMPHNCIGARVG